MNLTWNNSPRKTINDRYGRHVTAACYVVEGDWKLSDEKGRAITGYVVVREQKRYEHDARGGTVESFTGKFTVQSYSQRDGKRFGAIPRSTVFEKLDEAKAFAERAVAQQFKRYSKKFGSK